MNAPVIRHEQRQQQTLTPRLQQAVRLLQLSSLDFAQEVQQAIGNNPFLEPDESEQDSSTQASSTTPAAEAAAEAPLTGTVTEVAAVEPPPDKPECQLTPRPPRFTIDSPRRAALQGAHRKGL